LFKKNAANRCVGMTVNQWTGPQIAKVFAILTWILACLVFIVWWNFRLYVYFKEAGMDEWWAALLVFGPFLAVGIWSAWRYAGYRRKTLKDALLDMPSVGDDADFERPRDVGRKT
jgi:membrane protein YdbS with pleckstrin-like domain